MSVSVIKAIQSIYPEIKGGFSYWETKADCTPWDNPIDGLVWENEDFTKPTWEQIESELEQVEINSVFEQKEELLKQSRSKLLSSSKLSITLNGVSTEFDLHASDLPILQGRVDRLANNTDTLGWNDSQGNRVQLNKEAFRSLIRHIQVNDISTWDLYSEKLEELKSLKESGDLEGVKNFNTNL